MQYNVYIYYITYSISAFSSFGQYNTNISLKANLLSRHVEVGVVPEVWAKVEGDMKVGDAIYATVDIQGQLLNTSLPLTIVQNYGNWPQLARYIMYTCMYMCIYMYIVCVHVHIYMYVSVHTCTCMCMCVSVCFS